LASPSALGVAGTTRSTVRPTSDFQRIGLQAQHAGDQHQIVGDPMIGLGKPVDGAAFLPKTPR